jgi:hypothetical protein
MESLKTKQKPLSQGSFQKNNHQPPKKKIVRYSESNLDKYYLSPYVRYSLNNNRVYFSQWLFAKDLCLDCEPNSMQNFLEELASGLEQDQLIKKLKDIFKDQARQVLALLLKNGIIE